ncbi:MAG: right-handed parallel beta-helix repeat-containing protein, partial [Akkermansiaceae bacterium]|nr:right-handed parallel beta-helix repeat-containing protein [Armatimonadota bacterium]
EPGDTIEVAPGTYTDSVIIAYANNLLIRGKPGSPKPIIKPGPGEDYSLVRITGSSFITFTGFEVDGSDAGNNPGGILIVPRKTGTITTPCHHINVTYNKVHDVGGGGIGSNPDATYTIGNDYINITGNEIYNCLTTGKFRGSAVSLLDDEKFDDAGGYHSVIQNNKIYDNVNRNTDKDSDGNVNLFLHTDGNGIIIDTTGREGPKTLIQNNLVYRNGGRGIHVFNSSNVDVLNNTVAQNNLDPYLSLEGGGAGGGELTVVSASNVLFSNNVVQGNGEAPAFLASKVRGNESLYFNSNLRFRNNTYTATYALRTDDALIEAETRTALDWSTTIYHEPTWGNLFFNLVGGDFRLNLLATRSGLTAQQSQSARNRGSSVFREFSSNDILGVARKPAGGTSPGGGVDRGAYEQ